MYSSLLQHAKILIVDDEMPNVRLLEKLLLREGYSHVVMTTDSRRAHAMFCDEQPDLVLLDLHMPHFTGYEVMASLTQSIPAEDFVPIIVLTADITPSAKQNALAGGATDFISKPFDNMEVVLRIRNTLRIRFLHRQLEQERRILDERVRERTEFLQRTVLELQRVQQQLANQESAT